MTSDQDLDGLKAALRAATPTPDPARREKDLALARETFIALQGRRVAIEATPSRTAIGRAMHGAWRTLTSRAGRVATATAVVAVGFLALQPALFVPPTELAPPRTPDVPSPAPEMERSTSPALQGTAEPFTAAPDTSVSATASGLAPRAALEADRSSYEHIRAMLQAGQLPPAEAVNVLQMVNHVTYAYAPPRTDRPAAVLETMPTPWNADTQLVGIVLAANAATQTDQGMPAPDARLQIAFNPSVVTHYRDIGSDNWVRSHEEWVDTVLETGAINDRRGYALLYEITLVASPVAPVDQDILSLRWVHPGPDDLDPVAVPLTTSQSISRDTEFAAAMAGFGERLRGSGVVGQWSYDDAMALAISAQGDARHPEREEVIHLMRIAQGLSAR